MNADGTLIHAKFGFMWDDYPDLDSYRDVVSFCGNLNFFVGIRSDGTSDIRWERHCGYPADLEAAARNWNNVVKVVARYDHGNYFALTADGRVVDRSGNVRTGREKVVDFDYRDDVLAYLCSDGIVGIEIIDMFSRDRVERYRLPIADRMGNIVSAVLGKEMTFALSKDGTVRGTNKTVAEKISGWKDIVAIDADDEGCYALCRNGRVFVCTPDGITGVI